MPEFDYFAVVERFHTFQNPTSTEKLDRLIDYCGIADGHEPDPVGPTARAPAGAPARAGASGPQVSFDVTVFRMPVGGKLNAA